jgi:hypothetical protein
MRSEKATAGRTYLRQKNLASNREEWRKLLKEARAHTGLSSQ